MQSHKSHGRMVLGCLSSSLWSQPPLNCHKVSHLHHLIGCDHVLLLCVHNNGMTLSACQVHRHLGSPMHALLLGSVNCACDSGRFLVTITHSFSLGSTQLFPGVLLALRIFRGSFQFFEARYVRQ